MKLGIHYLSSRTLSPSQATENAQFVRAIEQQLGTNFVPVDENNWGEMDASFIFLMTGGTEKPFMDFSQKIPGPYYLITHNVYNSLASGLEILSYLSQQKVVGYVIHGEIADVAERIDSLAKHSMARRALQNNRLGIIGEQSEWLISSTPDTDKIMQSLGIELMRIPLDEVYQAIIENDLVPESVIKQFSKQEVPLNDLKMAYRIYLALKGIVERYRLDGFTIRCFDLIDRVDNSACLALALLNKDGITAGCEGDIPSLISMHLLRKLTNQSAFQANVARLSSASNRAVFAHCTIPLDMVQKYLLKTHFESNKGIGVKGEVACDKVTIFKLAPDLSSYYVKNAYINTNLNDPRLCRTQLEIQLSTSDMEYFFFRPIGNHHIIILGHHQKRIEKFLASFLGIQKR